MFRPLVWTSMGRPHPAAVRTLSYAAAQAAHRSELDPSAGALLSRWRHEIQVAIQRRGAAMARAVLPSPHAADAWLLAGQTAGVPDGEGRAPPLTEIDLVCSQNEEEGEESDEAGGT